MNKVNPGDGCSFCGKPRDQVEKLVPVQGRVQICNECLDICNEVVIDGQARSEQAGMIVGVRVPTAQALWASIDIPEYDQPVGQCVFSLLADIRELMKEGKTEWALPLDTFDSTEKGGKVKEIMIALGFGFEVRMDDPRRGDCFLVTWPPRQKPA